MQQKLSSKYYLLSAQVISSPVPALLKKLAGLSIEETIKQLIKICHYCQMSQVLGGFKFISLVS